MKKLTLSKGKAMTCLILICLFLLQACRKDRFGLINSDNYDNQQLIAESTIKNWIDVNPAAKLLTFDWSMARQGTLKGKHIVRIPVINNDNVTELLSKGELGMSNRGVTSFTIGQVPPKPGSNTNYNDKRPPEVFFIQDNKGSKLDSYLLNFIPDNIKSNTDKQSGKLYEWNLTGDTIFVQKVEGNILKEAYCMKLAQDPVIDNLETGLKNNKLQSLNGLKDRKIANFWKFLQYLPGNVLGWVGSLFGLSVYSENFSEGAGGWRLNINWSSVFGSGGNVGNNGSVGYVSSGWPIYNAYIPGVYYQGAGTVVEQGGGNPDSPGNPSDPNAVSLDDSFGPYPTSHGPNVSVNTLTADYVIRQLGIGEYSEQSFLRNPNNVEITAALADYVDKLPTLLQNDIEFGQWAVGYVTANPNDFDNFNRNVFVGPDQSFVDNDAGETTASLDLSNSGNAAFSSNGFDVFIPNVNLPDYGPNHPVSQAIINYNPWIYYSFVGANNTSLAHFHLTAKGQDAGDGYRKAIGAIGEGLFVSRLISIPTSPPANIFVAKMLGNTHIDALVVRNVPFVGGTGYEIAINYTDINGNYQQKRMHHPDGLTIGPIRETTIAYEVKTLNAQANTPESLYRMFKEGVKQVKHRANIPYMSAAVLVFDDKAWNKLRNSPYGAQAIDDIAVMSSVKNDDGEQKIYFRIEEGLSQDANRAFFGLRDRIKNL